MSLNQVFVLFVDWGIAKSEEGRYYREVAEFLIGRKQEMLNVFLSEKSEPSPWFYGCWPSVYKYYWPDNNIVFKTSALDPKDTTSSVFLVRWNKETNLYHPINYETEPLKGDFYVIKRTPFYAQDKALIDDMENSKVFENKLFEIYEIK